MEPENLVITGVLVFLAMVFIGYPLAGIVDAINHQTEVIQQERLERLCLEVFAEEGRNVNLPYSCQPFFNQ